ncbi:protein brunelleschi isoform X4 [Nilaparvata lugens]|uniref:protein brunelleschi isoform X4 n=1 Tax=Nilaparvata lugens TaxID=108931 RepID=UPI00193E5F67|nr:protein brunelleschi isoform X4 [Nilaparvata lugens]
MRSSVSVILSSPTPDPNMSHPDYEQTPHDHAAILVLVKHIGEELTAKCFNKIYERICRLNHIKVVDSNGTQRPVWAKYTKDYLVGNNDWGDFQTHRCLLGLISVGKCKNQVELNELCRLHETLKVKYSTTLYNSRCIILGVGGEGEEMPTPANFKSLALFYGSDGDLGAQFEAQLTEFLSSLFWVLESKRHKRCREKIERVSLLLAPFEKRDFVGLDMESRSNKKRCVGRMTKHLGDLCLQAGLPAEALGYYHTAAESLRAINDWLWIGGASEGLCAASAILLYPNMCRNYPVHRNSSLPEGSQTNPRSSISDPLEVSLPAPEVLHKPDKILSPDDILKSYREAIIHYSKYQNAGVIETEACYKAARIAIEQNSIVQAASFLQNVVFINLTLSEEEKIQRLMSLSELYTRIGFHRKASFYRRLAATRYVSARNPETNWEQCYNLMLQALPGYKLTLDPADYPPGRLVGWPGLQKLVLQDLVIAAKRVGHSAVATRHMTFLLQVMWNQLTAAERHDNALQLQILSSQCEGAPVPLVLDSGLVIPPANLINIPQTESFTIQNLKPHLRPCKLMKTKEDFGPFLFTPFNFGSLERKTKLPNKLDYLWVAEEMGEVTLQLTNPLSLELEVSNMRLLTSGVVFESLPLTLSLPPEAVNYSVTLMGSPKEVGELEITGYSTHTLGVKSNCRLKHIPKISQPTYTIEVIPALPVLNVSVQTRAKQLDPDSPQKTGASDWSGTAPSSMKDSSVCLYAGESMECVVVLKNESDRAVQWLDMSIETVLDPSVQRQTIWWDEDCALNQLPLEAGGTIQVPLHLYGHTNFLGVPPPSAFVPDSGSMKSSMFSGPSSFLSTASSARPGATPVSASSASFRSGPSSLNSFSSQFNKMSAENAPKTVVDCQLKVRYSGDPGLTSGYCRVSSANLHIDIIPSIIVTNWDVLPAETSDQFYLVLDIINMTNQELDLNYTDAKSILIEENESCRVPIPVERCPLSKIGKLLESADSMKDLVELSAACSEHIWSLVKLKWALATGECPRRSGEASLHGITLSSDMLDVVRMSPVNWEVLLNSKSIRSSQGESELTSKIGQCLNVGVWVHNSLSWPLVNLELSLQFFQDHQNGVTNYQLDTRLATAGVTQVQLPEVQEHGKVYHECNVVFFTPGQYKVNIQCTSSEKHVWKLIPPLEIEVSK